MCIYHIQSVYLVSIRHRTYHHYNSTLFHVLAGNHETISHHSGYYSGNNMFLCHVVDPGTTHPRTFHHQRKSMYHNLGAYLLHIRPRTSYRFCKLPCLYHLVYPSTSLLDIRHHP